MSKIRAYFEDTTNELFNKVSWPSWKELQDSAIIVMIASVIIAIIVFGIDKIFSYALEFIYSMFK